MPADGMPVSLVGTREHQGPVGTTGTGNGSFRSQLKIAALTACAGRAICGAVLGRARDGEQALPRTHVFGQFGLFAGRVDNRSCPSHPAPGRSLFRGSGYVKDSVLTMARLPALCSLSMARPGSPTTPAPNQKLQGTVVVLGDLSLR
jgi:hypothetical protein